MPFLAGERDISTHMILVVDFSPTFIHTDVGLHMVGHGIAANIVGICNYKNDAP